MAPRTGPHMTYKLLCLFHCCNFVWNINLVAETFYRKERNPCLFRVCKERGLYFVIKNRKVFWDVDRQTRWKQTFSWKWDPVSSVRCPHNALKLMSSKQHNPSRQNQCGVERSQLLNDEQDDDVTCICTGLCSWEAPLNNITPAPSTTILLSSCTQKGWHKGNLPQGVVSQ